MLFRLVWAFVTWRSGPFLWKDCWGQRVISWWWDSWILPDSLQFAFSCRKYLESGEREVNCFFPVLGWRMCRASEG
jgi:hypothetical protein